MFTTIPSGKYRFSSDHRSQTSLGGLSTWMGDRLGILRVVSSFFPCHCPIPLQNMELVKKYILFKHTCSRPYRLENAGSRPITAVKLAWAELVLGWETA